MIDYRKAINTMDGNDAPIEGDYLLDVSVDTFLKRLNVGAMERDNYYLIISSNKNPDIMSILPLKGWYARDSMRVQVVRACLFDNEVYEAKKHREDKEGS